MPVERALARVRVRKGDSSAGYSQGSSSQVAPKKMMKRKRPTAAPLALPTVPGIRQAMVTSMATVWPAEPIRNSLRRPARSIKAKEKRVERA